MSYDTIRCDVMRCDVRCPLVLMLLSPCPDRGYDNRDRGYDNRDRERDRDRGARDYGRERGKWQRPWTRQANTRDNALERWHNNTHVHVCACECGAACRDAHHTQHMCVNRRLDSDIDILFLGMWRSCLTPAARHVLACVLPSVSRS